MRYTIPDRIRKVCAVRVGANAEIGVGRVAVLKICREIPKAAVVSFADERNALSKRLCLFGINRCLIDVAEAVHVLN